MTRETVLILGDASVRGQYVDSVLSELATGWQWESGEAFNPSDYAALTDEFERDNLVFDAIDQSELVWHDNKTGDQWRLARNHNGDVISYNHTLLMWHAENAEYVCHDCYITLMTGDQSPDHDDGWDENACHKFATEHEIVAPIPEELKDMHGDLEHREIDSTPCESCGNRAHGSREPVVRIDP